VLSTTSDAAPAPAAATDVPLAPRPEALSGTTYKLKWPASDENFYVTINDIVNGGGRRRPFEIFIASRSADHAELLSALTITLSAIMRRTDDPSFLIEDLSTVRGAQGAWVNGRYVNGIVALIAEVMRRHLAALGLIEPVEERGAVMQAPEDTATPAGDTCPQCHAPTLFRQEGCKKCINCGYSTCG